MLCKKHNLVVGITTFNKEMLGISIPVLATLQKKFILIIHNDNPDITVKKSDIRKLGYRGKMHIINSNQNVGLRTARLNIVDCAKRVAKHAQWIIFANDDDVLTSVDIAPTSDNHFAIIQNSISVRSLSDLMKLRFNQNKIANDENRVVLNCPHLGLAGTAIRMNIMQELATLLRNAADTLQEIDSSLSYMPPVDMMMWNALNTYARHKNPECVPIFMDHINYIHNEIDRDIQKYDRPNRPTANPQKQIAHAMTRYGKAIKQALDATAAAPRGLE